MLKAKAFRDDGSPMAIIGLTHENLSRLVADEPIMFDMAEMDLPPLRVVIITGKTEDEIVEKLRPIITTNTEFRLPEVGRRGRG